MQIDLKRIERFILYADRCVTQRKIPVQFWPDAQVLVELSARAENCHTAQAGLCSFYVLKALQIDRPTVMPGPSYLRTEVLAATLLSLNSAFTAMELIVLTVPTLGRWSIEQRAGAKPQIIDLKPSHGAGLARETVKGVVPHLRTLLNLEALKKLDYAPFKAIGAYPLLAEDVNLGHEPLVESLRLLTEQFLSVTMDVWKLKKFHIPVLNSKLIARHTDKTLSHLTRFAMRPNRALDSDIHSALVGTLSALKAVERSDYHPLRAVYDALNAWDYRSQWIGATAELAARHQVDLLRFAAALRARSEKELRKRKPLLDKYQLDDLRLWYRESKSITHCVRQFRSAIKTFKVNVVKIKTPANLPLEMKNTLGWRYNIIQRLWKYRNWMANPVFRPLHFAIGMWLDNHRLLPAGISMQKLKVLIRTVRRYMYEDKRRTAFIHPALSASTGPRPEVQ